MTLEKLGGTFLNFKNKGTYHFLTISGKGSKGSATVTKNKPKAGVISTVTKRGGQTIIYSSNAPTRTINKGVQPNRNLVSPFLTGNVKTNTSKFIIQNNVGQSSLTNKGRANTPPIRQLIQSRDNINYTPRSTIGFYSEIQDGGRVHVQSQAQADAVNRIRQEQRASEILNIAQQKRHAKITASNFGQSTLGGGSYINILGDRVSRPYTALGNEVRTKGIGSVVENRFPKVENPTFTFGGTFGEKGNLVKQRTDNLSDPQIRNILDSGQAVQQSSPSPLAIFGPTRDNIPTLISSNPAPASLAVFGGLSSVKAVQKAPLQPLAFSVFGGSPKIQTPSEGKFGDLPFDFGGQPFNPISYASGMGAQAMNTGADIFDLNKLTKGVLGGSLGLFASRITENPIMRTPTGVETFYGATTESALATESIESGALKGLPAFGQGQESGEIFNSGMLQIQSQFAKDPSFEGGATTFGFMEIALPVGPISKVAKGSKLLGSNPTIFSNISDYFGGLFRTKPEVASGGKTTVTDAISKRTFESKFAPKVEVGRESFFPKTEKAKRLSEETAFRQGDDTKITTDKTGKVIKSEKLVTEDVGTLKTDSGIPKELRVGTDEFGKNIIGPPNPFRDDALKISKADAGLQDTRIGDDLISPELQNVAKNRNVDINLKATEIKAISREYKDLNNPFGTKDKGSGSVVKGINRDEAERIFDIRNENILPRTIEDVRIFNKVKKNKDDVFVGLGSTFLDTGAQAPNILGFGKSVIIPYSPKTENIGKLLAFENSNPLAPYGKGQLETSTKLNKIKSKLDPLENSDNKATKDFNAGKITQNQLDKIQSANQKKRNLITNQIDDFVDQNNLPITTGRNQYVTFVDEPRPSSLLLIGGGKGKPKGGKQKLIFGEPNPKNQLNIFDKSPNFKRPSLKAIGIGSAVGSGIGLGTFGLLNQDSIIKDDQIFGDGNLGLLDDLEITVTEGLDEDQLPKLDQDQILGQSFDDPIFPRFPSGQPQDQVPDTGFIPQKGLLQFQGNPPPVPFQFNSQFEPVGSGGQGGGVDDKGDFSFFRVFAVARQPFGKTTVPLGGFVDSDRPIDKISDVLTIGEIFRENRRTRNPLRSPKNIIDEDPLVNDLFGISNKKKTKKGKGKKGKKKSTNIFDLDIYA